MEIEHELNKHIKAKVGTDIYGHVFYKLVWSEDMTEIRNGTFNIFVGERFIRTLTGDHRVRKYNYIHERWILEKYFPPEISAVRELPESIDGSYEPVFVFEDASRNPLPVTMKVIDFLIEVSSGKLRKAEPGEIKTLHEKMDQKEIQDFIDMIDTSATQSLLHSREAVGYTKEIKDA